MFSIRRILATIAFALLVAPSAHAGGLFDSFGPPAWQANGIQVDGLFGFSVSAAGDVDGDGYGDVIVGADLEDSTFTNEGAAYLYRGSKNGSLLAPSWVVHGRQADAALGIAVAPAGDVNNDGYGDVLVGVSGWDTPTTSNAGKVMVFHGGPNGLSTTPAITLFSPTPSANEG